MNGILQFILRPVNGGVVSIWAIGHPEATGHEVALIEATNHHELP